MTDPAARTENLTRDFGPVRALDGLSMDVPRGAVLALLGPNGAGKTTLLRLLTGLIEPTAGAAFVLGRPARGNSTPGLAVVGENQDPPPWATPGFLEDLQASARPGFDRARFRRLLAQRGLDAGKSYRAMSKGQRRWVLAALALVGGAELILLDEPADGMDVAARHELYDLLRAATIDDGAAVLVATHILGDIERVADYVAILDRGRLLLAAPLEELREQVRQVDWPADQPLPDLGPDVTVLDTHRRDDTQVLRVRCPAGADGLAERLGGRGVVRPVDLETLYLAVTRGPQPAQTAQEVAP